MPIVAACGGTETSETPSPEPEYAVLVRGALFTDDLVAAQSLHDMLAAGGQPQAMAAGDFGHDVGLGTGLLATTTTTSFWAVDRWNDADAMGTFYMNPDFAAGFAELFDGPPIIEQFERRHDYHSWGDLDAADDQTRWVVVVRGRLAGDDPQTRQTGHDMAAMAGEQMVRAAGDVAHVAYTGLADDREFLAFDLWTSPDSIAAVYSDPDFQASFAALFSAPPSLQIYKTNDWHQW